MRTSPFRDEIARTTISSRGTHAKTFEDILVEGLFEAESYDERGPYEGVFGRAAFEGRRLHWDVPQLEAWEENVINDPIPVYMMTATAHFVDARGNIPGVRLGSDVRIYRRSLPVAYDLAVLQTMAVSQDWSYHLVFAYGERALDGDGIEGRVGILRIPSNIIGVELKSYHDYIDLNPYSISWDHIAATNSFDIAIAFPDTHPHAVVDSVEYSIPNPFPIIDLFILRDEDDIIYTPVQRGGDGSVTLIGNDDDVSAITDESPADEISEWVDIAITLPFMTEDQQPWDSDRTSDDGSFTFVSCLSTSFTFTLSDDECRAGMGEVRVGTSARTDFP